MSRCDGYTCTDKNFDFRPCILIFDSLAGASRSRVIATLRDYLTCEYKAKLIREKIFNKDSIKCACPKVPQQTNFTDCGLYLLQYVESFFAVNFNTINPEIFEFTIIVILGSNQKLPITNTSIKKLV